MKVIKFYESIDKDEPLIGDYVICEININTPVYNYINSHVSKLIKIYTYANIQEFYVIQYDEVPDNIRNQFIKIHKNEKFVYTYETGRTGIKYWSKDKKKLELILKTDKFNI